MGSHPVAVVQYTYTHKQYRERHKTNNTQNNTKIRKSAKKTTVWGAKWLILGLSDRNLTKNSELRKGMGQGADRT